MSDVFEPLPSGPGSPDGAPEVRPSGTTGVVGSLPDGAPRYRRLRSAVPALVAAVAVAAAGSLAGVLAPRWGAALAVVSIPAGVLAGIGIGRGRTWPGTFVVGALGAVYCLAVASRPVDVGTTSVVAIGFFLAFQVAAGPGGLVVRSPSSLALVALAALAGPVVLVLARGVSHVPPHLYLPALAAGVAAVVAPVLVATRPERDPDGEAPDS